MISLSEPMMWPVALRPSITCLPSPTFDTGHYYDVWSAFSSAASIALGQGWRKNVERDFAPGQVRTAWRGNALLIFAELSDQDIFSRAARADQKFWQLGDTFEIFLQPSDWLGYIEFHITPKNLRSHTCFPDAAARDNLRGCAIGGIRGDGGTFHSQTWVHPNAKRWSIYAEISARIFGKTLRSLCGCRWRFSFSRYDFTRSRKEPVISSTSPHARPDFHRQQEWGELIFDKPSSF